MKYFILFAFFLMAAVVHGQRVIVSLDDGWQFTKHAYIPADKKQQVGNWQPVRLPHTWNVADVMDDVPGYYRGACWYRKNIRISPALKKKNLFLYFEGANQSTEVFVNGKKAGSHIGGYSAFCIPVSAFINKDESADEISVKVDNSADENVPPLSADFTFYGGLYRHAYLIAAGDVHFTLIDHASEGLYISTPAVSENKATVNIKGSFVNESGITRQLRISSIITDKQHRKIAEKITISTVEAGKDGNFTQEITNIMHPHLWSPDDPYLYTIETRITEFSSGKLLDEVINPLGFRWFHFDAAKGFFLNGKSCKLMGTSRHQDYPGVGNAVNKQMAREDLVLIKNAGFNFFRVAHYPQDPAVLQACDELGLLASVEIPVVNEITESQAFYDNCNKMQVEMIRQNYNHPSVIIWCYMNEIFLRPHFANDKERQKQYFSSVEKLARSLDSLTRKEDPYRYTMIANHADYNRYHEYHLTDIAMLTGWNLYSGWYSGRQEDFPAFLDRHHEQLPKQPFMITEYGADADPRIRSIDPLRFDKSVEYATNFHQFYITEIMKRPFVAGAVVWNLADFNSETRAESMPHINNKGLVTWNRIPKDPYYLYQAIFLKRGFVKITSSAWKLRGGMADSSGAFCLQPLRAATNIGYLTLKLNDKILGVSPAINGLAGWNIPFVNGLNNLEVSGFKDGKKYTDTLAVQFLLQSFSCAESKTDFKELNILLGAKRYFVEEKNQQIWIPGQAYRPGSWGSVGGRPYALENNSHLPYGTDRNIAGTDDDPIYQTQMVGLKNYRFDVPAGEYELTLHFAELQGGVIKLPPYNLSDLSRDEKNVRRIFNVTVNNIPLLENFNIAEQVGAARASSKKTTVSVQGDHGILITFNAIQGEPVVNAIQLKAVPKAIENFSSSH